MISKYVQSSLEKGSWVRKIFENRKQMIEEYGPERVYDFSLGNPVHEPPQEMVRAMQNALGRKNIHGYMENHGFPETREKLAAQLKQELGQELTRDHFTMCCGAGGGLNVVFKTIFNPGDELIVFAPYFPEYFFYAENCKALCKVSQTDDLFDPVPEKLEEKISPRTRVVLINSPNNPTGRVYSQKLLNEIGKVIRQAEQKYKHSIYLVSDEPYRRLLFDGVENPNVFEAHPNSILVNSHSKDYGLAGERIGYIAIHPEAAHAKELHVGMGFCNRILGFVNAPALMQIALAEFEETKPNFDWLGKIRDDFYDVLTKTGMTMKKPQGAFYFFPEIPMEDDVEFVMRAKEKRILLVPGSGFGRKKHVRISYSADPNLIQNSYPAFRELMSELKYD